MLELNKLLVINYIGWLMY